MMDEPYYILGDITHTEPVPIDQAITFRPARRFVPIPITEISRPLKRRQKMVEGAYAHLETENTQPKGMVDQLALAKANYWAMKHAQDLKNQKSLDQKALAKHKAAMEAAAEAMKKLNKPMSEADREDDDDTSAPPIPAEEAAAVAQQEANKPPNLDADNPANQAGENAAAAAESVLKYDQFKASLPTYPSGNDIKTLIRLALEDENNVEKIQDLLEWLTLYTENLFVKPIENVENEQISDTDLNAMIHENMQNIKTLQSLQGLPDEIINALQQQYDKLDAKLVKNPPSALAIENPPVSVGDVGKGEASIPLKDEDIPLDQYQNQENAAGLPSTTDVPAPKDNFSDQPTVNGSESLDDKDPETFVNNHVGAAGNRNTMKTENDISVLYQLTPAGIQKWEAMKNAIDNSGNPAWQSSNFENTLVKLARHPKSTETSRGKRKAIIESYDERQKWEDTRKRFLSKDEGAISKAEGWVASVGGGLSPKIMDSMIAAQNEGGWTLPSDETTNKWMQDFDINSLERMENLGRELFLKWTPSKQHTILTKFCKGSGARLAYNGELFSLKKLEGRYRQLMFYFYAFLGLSYVRDTLTLKIMMAQSIIDKYYKFKNKKGKENPVTKEQRKQAEEVVARNKTILSSIYDIYKKYLMSSHFTQLRRALSKFAEEEAIPAELTNPKTRNFLVKKIRKNPKAMIKYLTHAGEYGAEAIPSNTAFPTKVLSLDHVDESEQYQPRKSLKDLNLRRKMINKRKLKALEDEAVHALTGKGKDDWYYEEAKKLAKATKDLEPPEPVSVIRRQKKKPLIVPVGPNLVHDIRSNKTLRKTSRGWMDPKLARTVVDASLYKRPRPEEEYETEAEINRAKKRLRTTKAAAKSRILAKLPPGTTLGRTSTGFWTAKRPGVTVKDLVTVDDYVIPSEPSVQPKKSTTSTSPYFSLDLGDDEDDIVYPDLN